MAQVMFKESQFAGANVDLKIKVVSRLDDIKALEKDWRALEQCGANDMALFQSFDWNWRWCESCLSIDQQIGERKIPQIVVVYQNDKAVSIWPLQIEIRSKITLVEWLSAPALQYGGALLHKNFDADVLCTMAWNAIIALPDIDLIRLSNVAKTDVLHSFLAARCSRTADTRAFYLRTDGFNTAQDYHASLKKSTRRARRKRLHKLQRAGEMQFFVHDSPEQIALLARRAIDWKRDWLAERNWPTGLMGIDCFKDFVEALARRDGPASSKWVMGELCLDGEPIALELGAVYGRRYYSYLGAYDANYQQFSPGKIEMESMIHWAIDGEIDAFDFLAVPSQYKSDWTDHSIDVGNFTYTASLRGQLMHSVWIKRLRPAVKYSLQHLPVSQRKMILSFIREKSGG